MILLPIDDSIFRRSQSVNFSPSKIPRCFWHENFGNLNVIEK